MLCFLDKWGIIDTVLWDGIGDFDSCIFPVPDTRAKFSRAGMNDQGNLLSGKEGMEIWKNMRRNRR